MARLGKHENDDWQERDGEGRRACSDRTDGMLARLMEASDAVDIDAGTVEGVVLQFPVADGYAIYRVSRASPLTLEHIPVGDAWRIPAAHIRGIRRRDVLEQAAGRRALVEAFGNQRSFAYTHRRRKGS